ncbi:MAG: YdeI/OmpD-associated family protein [Terracidiphilus sp.]
MKSGAKKSFAAILEPDGTALKWTIARVPFDIAKVWPERRGHRVKGEISSLDAEGGGFAFRTSLFPDSRGKGRVLLVNKKMQKGAHARVGEKVRITLEPDLEEREVLIPPELDKILKSDRQLKKWFGALSDSMRREIGKWVAAATGVETRLKRADRIAERMMHAMEGEIDTPPILKAAFVRQPLAESGWKAMTLAQRRGHLMGISGYEKAESRERRAAKAVEEALKVARRKLSAPK